MAIWFKKENPEYGCFSNFFPSPVDLEGVIYATSEHYYQAMKAKTQEEHDYIAEAPTPHESRNRGKQCQIRDGWDNMRDDVMLTVVVTKFTQHSNLADILLSTGDEELIEWAPWDKYWGKAEDGQGKNKLGKILMQVRDKLKNGTIL